jgi:hypothetical protein
MATQTYSDPVEIRRSRVSARHMTKEMDIQHAAERFIERFGNDAPREAAMRMNELRDSGDHDGHELWQKIYQCVSDIVGKG